MESFGTISLAVILFATTNIDDILLLVMFYSNREMRDREIVLGQYLGVGALVIISLVAAVAALAIPESYIRFLGLIPIALGLKKLWDLRTPTDQGRERVLRTDPSAGFVGRIMSVTAVTFANGGDNVGVYTPLFASQTVEDLIVIVTVFALMILVWCLMARALVNHRGIGPFIEEYGHKLLPFVLISLGLYILWLH